MDKCSENLVHLSCSEFIIREKERERQIERESERDIYIYIRYE
jgi:hypothetical protein